MAVLPFNQNLQKTIQLRVNIWYRFATQPQFLSQLQVHPIHMFTPNTEQNTFSLPAFDKTTF